jgi:hypothetical protein
MRFIFIPEALLNELILLLYHAKELNRDYRIARFAAFGKRKTGFFAECRKTSVFRRSFWAFCAKKLLRNSLRHR